MSNGYTRATLELEQADREARFWNKVDKHGPLWNGTYCWLWMGACAGRGYGHLLTGGQWKYAHRFAYELLIGPIPIGLTLDHLCRVLLCVNPFHLEAVTCQENLRRGIGHGSETHCPQGHPYDAVNTYRDKLGKRSCRACWRLPEQVEAKRRRGAKQYAIKKSRANGGQ